MSFIDGTAEAAAVEVTVLMARLKGKPRRYDPIANLVIRRAYHGSDKASCDCLFKAKFVQNL